MKERNGKEFERESFLFLQNKFEKVEWLSEFESSSPYDFICFQYGKKFIGDAKSGKNKPRLTPNQKDLDFVVYKKDGEIKLLFKEDFENKVNFSNFTTIKIHIDTKGKLDKLKKHHRQSYDEIIKELIK